MRLQRLLPLMTLLGAACAPGARSREITPAAIERGPRYQLVYVTVGSATVDPKVVAEVGVVIQQELAAKGMLLAAPWETPTLVVRYVLRGASEDRFDVRTSGTPLDVTDAAMVQPVSYSRSTSSCDGSRESMGHCSALDAPMPALPLSSRIVQQRRSLGLEIRELSSDRLVWSDVRSDDGEWTRARTLRIRPLVQATLSQATFSEGP